MQHGSPKEAELRGKMEVELQAISNYPEVGGTCIDAKDASLAPKLYHACVALKAIKV